MSRLRVRTRYCFTGGEEIEALPRAPEGGKAPALSVGTRVRASHEMVRVEREGGIRDWVRVPLDPDVVGVVVGIRTVTSGRYSPGTRFRMTYWEGEDYEAPYLTATCHHRTVLVAYHLRRAPMVVHADDVRLDGEAESS